MAALNYFIGVKRGDLYDPGKVVIGTASAGTAVDVEVNMQINDGTNATGLTRKDVVLALNALRSYVIAGGLDAKGVDLPPL